MAAANMTYKEFAKEMLARLPADMAQTIKMQQVGAGWRALKAKQGIVVKPKVPKAAKVPKVAKAVSDNGSDLFAGLLANVSSPVVHTVGKASTVAASAAGAAGKKVKKAKLSKAAALQKLEAVKAALADLF